MPIYRKCSQCGGKVPVGSTCVCEDKARRKSYRDYKKRRLQDADEKQRQKFYVESSWLNLSESIKVHYFGLCVMCWDKEAIQENAFTHHIETIKDRFDLRLSNDNLIPVCDCCHKNIHKAYDKSKKDMINMQKTLKQLIIRFNEIYY